ncbi:glycoside hydrolase family 88 protein [Alkalimonas collagenimarina]|uniref:Glycoside hydrolase family 88 protein n=1 Tax=Alkalimonas collagenimarina TaxID=400390 RepID=A0ABT9H0J6_9GAMM|nr:glycoside hydrolase family 88 protein [Alkalimonas collagenimarina]MDP4536816.1 glycoside hydrolase family 88 protein [Alkalimonas collagenimarina]
MKKIMQCSSLIPTLAGSMLILTALIGCDNQSTLPTHSEQPDPNSSVLWIASLEVHNPSEFARPDQPLLVPFADLGLTTAEATALVAKRQGQLIPSQLIDHSGDGEKDTLYLHLSMAAAERQQLLIVQDKALFASQNWPARTQAEISHKVGGEWQEAKYSGGDFINVTELTPPPQYTDHSEWIRYEGPGIESDKVGYRIYLDWRNGFDTFGKKTNDLVLQDVGQDGYQSYHEMADWGMDILKVGLTLGAGGYGFWDGEQVQLVSKVGQHHARIHESGPLYSGMQIHYQDWQIAGKTLDLTANFSMTPGSRLVHTRLELSDALPHVAIGLIKHPDTEVIHGPEDITGHAWTYVATWGDQSLAGDQLGMALLFKKSTRLQQTEDEHNLVSLIRVPDQTMEYYFLSAWQGEPDGIRTKAEFIAYLEQQIEQLTLTPRVRLDTALTNQQVQQPLTAERALHWSDQLAASDMQRQTPYYRYGGWDYERRRPATWEYTTGLLLQAYDDLHQVKPNPEWRQVVSDVVDSFITEDGDIHTYDINKYNIDSLNTGVILLREYLNNPQPNYRAALDLMRRQVAEHPRTEDGAFWHKQVYPHQLWLDGVYMGMPFYAFYSNEFEQGAGLDEVVKEFTLTRDLLRDPDTGLYFHAWDEARQQNWADPETGLSPHFWGRGFGWLTMALVDVLDHIPHEQTELRQPLLDMITDIAATLAQYQDPETGVWYQILDRPEAPGNYLESSGSAMFTYFYAKALNQGYLPEQYRATAEKAYQGLLQEFVLVHPDDSISLVNTVQVAGLGFGRDGSYRYYMSEPVFRNDAKANGPFIMAGVQMAQLLSH